MIKTIVLIDYNELAICEDIQALKVVASMDNIELQVTIPTKKQRIRLSHDSRYYERWLVSLVGSCSIKPFNSLNEATDYIFKTLYYMK